MYFSTSVTDDTLPDRVNCSNQQTATSPPPKTTVTNTYVIPVASAVTGFILLGIITVFLVLVAKRRCKYSLSPDGEDREQLLPNNFTTEDPGYGEYGFIHIVCIMHNVCVCMYIYVCMCVCLFVCLFVCFVC